MGSKKRAEEKPSNRGKPTPPSRDDVIFPFSSAELLEKGLGELGFPSSGAEGSAGTARYRVPCVEPTGVSIEVRTVPSILALANRYIRELELFNAVFDLVGAESGSDKGRSDLVVRHILDSLAPWREIASLASAVRGASLAGGASAGSAGDLRAVEVADAGSGAGFPGIPLAIAFPDLHFTLVERMSKRCAFLENCVAMLGLKNVTVLNSEVEKAPAHAFDIVVFRAFRPLDAAMTKTLLRMARESDNGSDVGVLAAWKARKDKIDEELAGIRDLVVMRNCARLAVPFLGHEERHLVVLSSPL